MSTPGGEQNVAKDNLDKGKKLIDDLQKKGCDVSEAKGWYDQANDMYRSGLYRTSLIYSGYALDAANEIVQKIKDMVLRVTKVKARAVDMLGKDHKNMPHIDEMIVEMKTAINEGRLDDCQELVNQVDELLRGGSSPYLATKHVRSEPIVKTVTPSRGYSSCPSCGNITESTWTVCKYCDQDLSNEDDGAGPAWSKSGSGPLMVSDKNEEDIDPQPSDDGTSEDLQQMETIQSQMEVVETDLARTDSELVQRTERTVDQETSDDMKEQDNIQSEESIVETDLQKTDKYLVVQAERTVDQETSDDLKEQEAIQKQMEKVESDIDGPSEKQPSVEETPKPVELPPPLVPANVLPKPPEAPLAQPPAPEPPKPLSPPLVANTDTTRPGPLPSQAPKRFYIPPPPKIDFDITTPLFPRVAAGLSKCPKCGEDVEPDFLKCPFCKAPLK